MCTNVALVDSLECYMDELVDSFQDFVRKSLLIITLAVGSLIGLLLYILKLIKQRNGNFAYGDMPDLGPGMRNQMMSSQTGRSSTATSGTSPKVNTSDPSIDQKMCETDPNSDSLFDQSSTIRKRCCNPSCGKSTSVSANFMTTPDVSTKEMELRNVGLSSCPTNCIGRNESDRPSRITIPSLPTCEASCKTFKPTSPIPDVSTRSCCSMCCGEQK